MAIDPATVAAKCDTSNPASLASFYYGADTLFGHYRKVVLAACRESIRASATLAGGKLTESRLDDLAHLHPAYLAFLADHLAGRTTWMAHFQRESGTL